MFSQPVVVGYELFLMYFASFFSDFLVIIFTSICMCVCVYVRWCFPYCKYNMRIELERERESTERASSWLSLRFSSSRYLGQVTCFIAVSCKFAETSTSVGRWLVQSSKRAHVKVNGEIAFGKKPGFVDSFETVTKRGFVRHPDDCGRLILWWRKFDLEIQSSRRCNLFNVV